MHLAYLEEEDAGNGEDQDSDDPSGIEGVTEEFMVHLARVVKDAQVDEKCCYHLWEMLESGAIWPSHSAWCNSVMLVWKKDGGLHSSVLTFAT